MMQNTDGKINNLKTMYPFLVDHMVAYSDLNEFELLVKLDDGSSIIYDDVDGTFRNLPHDSNNMSELDFRKEFGARLSKIMKHKSISNQELSEKTGISEAMLSTYRNGRTNPSFYKTDKIAKALGCSTDEFRYLDNEEKR